MRLRQVFGPKMDSSPNVVGSGRLKKPISLPPLSVVAQTCCCLLPVPRPQRTIVSPPRKRHFTSFFSNSWCSWCAKSDSVFLPFSGRGADSVFAGERVD